MGDYNKESKTRMTVELDNVVFDVIVTRRRYGRQFYTWIDYFKGPDGVCYSSKNELGCDPFPCTNPKKFELTQLLKEWITDGRKWIYKNGKQIFID